MIDHTQFNLALTDHQLKAVVGTVNRPYCLNVMGTGRGKTYVVAGLIKVLAAKGQAKVALVLTSPRGVMAYAKLKGSKALVPFSVCHSVADLAELMKRRLSGDQSDSCIVISVKSLMLWMGRLLSSIGASGSEDWEASVRRSVSRGIASVATSPVTGGDRPQSYEPGSEAYTPAETSSKKLKMQKNAITTMNMIKMISSSETLSLSGNSISQTIGSREEVRRGDEIVPLAYSPLRGITPSTEPVPVPREREKIPALSSFPSRRVSALGALLLSLLNPDTLFIDEVHDYRNMDSEAYLALSALLATYRGRRQGLTATPIYRALEDTYAICSLVAPGLFPSYNAFSDTYLIREPKEVWTSRYVKTPTGMRKMPFQQVTYPITGVKNQDRLRAVLEPYLYLDVGTDFITHVMPTEYELSGTDIDAYSSAARGVGLGELTRVKYITPDLKQPKQVLLKSQETFWQAKTYQGASSEAKPGDLMPGCFLDLPGGSRAEIVSVDTKITAADLTQRLVPMMRTLSATASKLAMLRAKIDAHPRKGMLIFCAYKESLIVVRDQLLAWGHTVIAITGGETNMKKKLASITDSTYVVITPVAIQSLDFYLRHLVIYEPVTLPGPLVQLLGRITRENADFREVWVHVLYCRRGVDYYFLLRLERLLRDDPLVERSLGFSLHLNELPNAGEGELDYLKKFILWGMSGKKETY